MKISIIITTYNRVDLLRRAISSALAQTLPCEIIVIDDGSTDGTADHVIGSGERVKYWRNPRNSGHAASVNRGVSLATGSWIKLLDDDDYLAPDCLEVMSREIFRYPRSVIASCRAIQVDRDGVEIERTRRIGREETLLVPRTDIHYRMLLEYLPFGTPAQVMFQKEAFLKSGGWNSEFDLDYDDIESWVRISCFGDALFINRCLAYRTVWTGGYNRQFSIPERLQKNLAIKEKIHALVDEKYRESLPSLKTIEDYLTLYWAFIALKRLQSALFCRLLFSAILSVKAWWLLFKVLSARVATDDRRSEEN